MLAFCWRAIDGSSRPGRQEPRATSHGNQSVSGRRRQTRKRHDSFNNKDSRSRHPRLVHRAEINDGLKLASDIWTSQKRRLGTVFEWVCEDNCRLKKAGRPTIRTQGARQRLLIILLYVKARLSNGGAAFIRSQCTCVTSGWPGSRWGGVGGVLQPAACNNLQQGVGPLASLSKQTHRPKRVQKSGDSRID